MVLIGIAVGITSEPKPPNSLRVCTRARDLLGRLETCRQICHSIICSLGTSLLPSTSDHLLMNATAAANNPRVLFELHIFHAIIVFPCVIKISVERKNFQRWLGIGESTPLHSIAGTPNRRPPYSYFHIQFGSLK